jgi:tryptophan synthase alpha chain
MSSIAQRFAHLREEGEKALVCYFTAGDPSLENLPSIIDALQEAGTDVIEVGMPFSDPIADGPTIQASTQRALDRGVTPVQVLDAIARANAKVPIVMMGYTNPVYHWGFERFAQAAKEVGLSGSILSDLTPEEAEGWISASRETGLDTIFLAAPTSTDERLDAVCKSSSGFVYAVSRTGVTSAGIEVPHDVQDLVRRIKMRTELPVCVGFGISKPEHVRMVCEVADGAVVGSWLVDLLAEKWQGGEGREEVVNKVGQLKAATQV